MRVVRRFLALLVAGLVAWWLIGAAFGLIGAVIGVAFRVAMIAAIGGAGLWVYRRLSGGGRRLSSGGRRESKSLRSGTENADMAYIRGKIDKQEYLRRKSG